MRNLILVALYFSLSLTLLAEAESFVTLEGKTLQHPTFIRQVENKAVILHDEGVEFLELNTAVLEYFKVSLAPPVTLPCALSKNMVESWLIEIETQAKIKPKVVSPRKVVSVKAPTSAPKTIKTVLSAKELASKYVPADYNGVEVEVSGTVTSIKEGEGSYLITLDNAVAFLYESKNRITARAMDGSPKSVGAFTVGYSASYFGTCVGIDESEIVMLRGE